MHSIFLICMLLTSTGHCRKTELLFKTKKSPPLDPTVFLTDIYFVYVQDKQLKYFIFPQQSHVTILARIQERCGRHLQSYRADKHSGGGGRKEVGHSLLATLCSKVQSGEVEMDVKVESESHSNDICHGRLASIAENQPVMREVQLMQVKTDPLME